MKTGKLLSNYELSSFCQQTYYLLQAGITPSDGMDILLQDTDQHFMQEMIRQIRDTCLQGEKFSKALETAEPSVLLRARPMTIPRITPTSNLKGRLLKNLFIKFPPVAQNHSALFFVTIISLYRKNVNNFI